MLKEISEGSFREFLKEKGFIVNEKHESNPSLDIVAIKNGEYFLIDVKTTTTLNRVRTDLVSEDAEFGIAICDNGYFYPCKIKTGKVAKAHRFMGML